MVNSPRYETKLSQMCLMKLKFLTKNVEVCDFLNKKMRHLFLEKNKNTDIIQVKNY